MWANGRVTANAAVFHIDWEDMQLNLPEPARAGAVLHRQRRRRDEHGRRVRAERPRASERGSCSAASATRTRRVLGRQHVSNGVPVGGNNIPNTPDYTVTLGDADLASVAARQRSTAALKRCSTARSSTTISTSRGRTPTRWPISAPACAARLVFVEAWMRNAFDTKYIPVAFAYGAFAPSGFIGEMGRPRTFGMSAGVTFLNSQLPAAKGHEDRDAQFIRDLASSSSELGRGVVRGDGQWRPGSFDWPQWRGPDRNGVSKETGLLQQWPPSGPPVVWSIVEPGRRLRLDRRAGRSHLRAGLRNGAERRLRPESRRRQGRLVEGARCRPATTIAAPDRAARRPSTATPLRADRERRSRVPESADGTAVWQRNILQGLRRPQHPLADQRVAARRRRPRHRHARRPRRRHGGARQDDRARRSGPARS